MEKSKRYVAVNGDITWYLPSKGINHYHRLNGPAFIYSDGTKSWFVDGQLHRIDGPAVEYSNGSKEWYVDNKLHRIDGPAVEHSNGIRQWYMNGILLDKNKIEIWLEENDIDLKTMEGQAAFKLRFS